MYSLRLACPREEIDRLSAELWEAGTVAIYETDLPSNEVLLMAGFDADEQRAMLVQRFAAYSPDWRQEPAIDWTAQTRAAWPARLVGDRLFLAPPWCNDPTPPGRFRLIHNPGLACGTGEHPCTQLALAALEKHIHPAATVTDIGTGSGILAIAALRLGAASAIGVDPDEAALSTARENFSLNALPPLLAAGSADCLAAETSDLTVANINATVLLSLFDHLLRITKRHGRLILTGFTEPESPRFLKLLPGAEVSTLAEWCCVTATLS